MNQPYKVCPHCGQPAVLAMPQCRRCGFVYPTVPMTPERSAAVSRGRRAAPLLVLLVFALLLIVLGVGLSRSLFSRHSSANGLVFSNAKPLSAADSGIANAPSTPNANSAVTNAPSAPSADSDTSLFSARSSRTEMPTIHVTNAEVDNMTLTLRDRTGHIYQAQSRDGHTTTIQVPPGDYSVEVVSSNPEITPNSGDAVFRRFTEYDADFVYSTESTRIHLGD